jgi:polar amino acid transport system permease protein
MLDLTRLAAALPELAAGALNTVGLTACAALVSWVGGVLVVMAVLSHNGWIRRTGRLYVSFMRGTPALIQLFIIFFALPMLGLRISPFLAAGLTLGLNSAAYVGEILRAAILAVPPGQIEAGTMIGMRQRARWRRIVLPQAVATSLPALTNELTLLLKTTPLASVVAVKDLTFAGQIIVARTFEPTEVLLAVALGYIVVAQGLLQISRYLERRVALWRI